jgi:hypothetical protein
MKLIRKYIIGCLLMLGFTGIKAQQTQLKGFVLSIDNNQIVPLANILNKTTQQRFIASRLGLFKANLSQTDSIVITAIGYEPLLFVAKDIWPENEADTIKVFMRPTAYQLKEIAIIYSNHKRDSIAQAAAEFLKSDPLMNNYDRVIKRDQGSIMSPLTAMWNEYSKAGQDMKHFEDFMHHAQMLSQVNARYNKQTIKRATGLNYEYLDDYIMYCNIDKVFVLNASDYDLILAMRNCATRFKSEKGID